MKKFVIVMCTLLFVAGCATSHLDNGEESVATFEDGGISAQDLYERLKETYGAQELITLIDTMLLEKEYDDMDKAEEKAYIKDAIKSLKADLGDNFLTTIKSYYGVNNEDELEEYLRLNYRRTLWRTDYAESQVNDTQIEDYYNDHVVGNIEANHILISSEVASNASDEEKKAAEDKAREEALSLIERLNNGEKFEDLAKEYSDDASNSSKGGKLDPFNDRTNFDANFLEAAISLEVGKYTTTPVKSAYGYHIIYKTKQADKPELKDVKDEIVAKIAQELISQDSNFSSKSLLGLREKYGLKITDSDLESDYNSLYGL